MDRSGPDGPALVQRPLALRAEVAENHLERQALLFGSFAGCGPLKWSSNLKLQLHHGEY